MKEILPKPLSSSKAYLLPWAGLIFLITLIPFQGALDNEFVNWDDDFLVYENPMIQSVNSANLEKMFTGFHPTYWMPLTFLSHALDFRIYRFHSGGHHLTSLLLHGINVCLVFFLFIALAGRMRGDLSNAPAILAGGTLAALAYGLHPLRVESVAWIAERKDVLSGLFFLSTLLAYLRYRKEEENKSRLFWYGACLTLFIFALMSKPMTVTLPLIFLLLDFYPLNRFVIKENWFYIILEKAPFLILSLALGIHALISEKALSLGEGLQIGDRILNAVENFSFYLGKTLWPFGLNPLYAFPDSMTWIRGPFLMGVSVVFGVTYFCARRWKKGEKIWMLAWLYYLITLLPVSGIVQVGGHKAADRFTYLPTLSFFLLMGAGFMRFWEEDSLSPRQGRKKLTAVACGVICLTLLGDLTAHQVKAWENSETLWKRVIAFSPGKLPEAHVNLGIYYRKGNRLVEALAEFETALKINPELTQAYNNLGLVFHRKGSLEEAEAMFGKALQIDPDFVNARNNLAILLIMKGNASAAEEELKRVLTVDPWNADAFSNLGILYAQTGRREAAERAFMKAIELAPFKMQAHFNLGLLYLETGRPHRAEDRFKRVLEIAPGHELALSHLKRLQRENGP